MDSDDDILAGFIEDAREHLSGIEAWLMDMEQAGAGADPELVNTVFRAAHSIKGGAGFLGLDNARDLAHRLENVLHMMRSGEMVPSPATVSPLLRAFDLLRALAEEGKAGNERDISAELDALSQLAASHLPGGGKDLIGHSALVGAPDGGPAFSVDRLTLEQALKGGKHLYLVEYDLIHDVHARGKTPLDILSMAESSGLILDCRVELDAVGDLDAPLSNKIPFFLLFATIVEPDVARFLFALDASRIRQLDTAPLLAQPAQAGALVIALEGEMHAGALEELKAAVLAAMQANTWLALDAARATGAGSAFAQFVCAAQRSLAARGGGLCVRNLPPEEAGRIARLGLGPDLAALFGFTSCTLTEPRQ